MMADGLENDKGCSMYHEYLYGSEAELYAFYRLPKALIIVKDFLKSYEIENIIENSDFVLMFNQGSGDKNILAERLDISPEQLRYVTGAEEGCGLLSYGGVILPFEDKYPKDTEMYKVMTTKLSEVVSVEQG